MGKKALEETEQFKNILIHAYQKGELSSNITTKDLINDLIAQLQPFLNIKNKSNS
jgi:cellobiose-specific phosphotransferase system component IIA